MPVNDQIRNQACRKRCEQDAIPVVPGGIDHPVGERRGADEGESVRRGRTEPHTSFDEGGAPGLWQELARGIEQIPYASRCGPFVEADVFHCCPDKDGAVLPGHHVAVGPPDNMTQRSSAPVQPQQLPPHGTNARRGGVVHLEEPGPAPGSNDRPAGGPRGPVVGSDRYPGTFDAYSGDPVRRLYLDPVAKCRPGESVHKGGHRDIAVTWGKDRPLN